jgi:hypothetical protein
MSAGRVSGLLALTLGNSVLSGLPLMDASVALLNPDRGCQREPGSGDDVHGSQSVRSAVLASLD